MGASWGPWGAAHQEHTAQCGGGAECLQRVMGRECASCAHGLGLARGSLAGTLCRGARVPRLGKQTPDHASGPHPPAGHSIRSLGRSHQECPRPVPGGGGPACLHPCSPRGPPSVPPQSPEVPGGPALQCTQLASCCPLDQSCFPASAIWGHLPNELFTLSQVCCCGTQKDTDPRGAGGSASARGVNGRGWNGQWRPLCTDRLGW